MNQVLKKYTKVMDTFVEDANGFCIGFEWVDDTNIGRRVIYTKSEDNLELLFTNAVCVFQLYDVKLSKWVTIENKTFTAHRNSYIDTTTGLLERDPYDRVVTTDPDTGDVSVSHTLKPNLIPEFDAIYAQQFLIFREILKAIQRREFEATSFS